VPPRLVADMLPLWSSSTTTVVAARPPGALVPLSAGRLIASASAATASVRSSSNSHCLRRRRRISLWFTSVRNSSDGKRTSRGRLRVKRWIRIGIAAAARPKR
jgi:hypothetical protein